MTFRPKTSSELVTAREVGGLLRVSRSQVYKLRTAGILPPHFQVFPGSRGARWLRQDIEAFINRARTDRATAPGPRPFVAVKLTGSPMEPASFEIMDS